MPRGVRVELERPVTRRVLAMDRGSAEVMQRAPDQHERAGAPRRGQRWHGRPRVGRRIEAPHVVAREDLARRGLRQVAAGDVHVDAVGRDTHVREPVGHVRETVPGVRRDVIGVDTRLRDEARDVSAEQVHEAVHDRGPGFRALHERGRERRPRDAQRGDRRPWARGVRGRSNPPTTQAASAAPHRGRITALVARPDAT